MFPGWGTNVTAASVGSLSYIDEDGDVFIEFPSQSGWQGRIEEIGHASVAAAVQVSLPAHHAHPLRLAQNTGEHTLCDLCRTMLGVAAARYRCTVARCNFDVCVACVAKTAKLPSASSVASSAAEAGGGNNGHNGSNGDDDDDEDWHELIEAAARSSSSASSRSDSGGGSLPHSRSHSPSSPSLPAAAPELRAHLSEIDPDNMTEAELLALEERMGHVSIDVSSKVVIHSIEDLPLHAYKQVRFRYCFVQCGMQLYLLAPVQFASFDHSVICYS
jgi:hypothetical protein